MSAEAHGGNVPVGQDALPYQHQRIRLIHDWSADPMTPEHFGGHPYDGIGLHYFGQDAEWAAAFGHVEPLVMAGAVYRAEDQADHNDGYELDFSEEIAHAYAVIGHEPGAEDDEGWFIRWRDEAGNLISAAAPGAFPVTVADCRGMR